MDEDFLHASFRPCGTPTPPVPIGARSVGHYKVFPGYNDMVLRKNFTQVFWSVSGSGLIEHQGQEAVLDAGMISVYLPGDLHRVYHLGPGVWEYRWWTMDGPFAEKILTAFGFQKGGTYRTNGAVPVPLFEKLEAAIKDVSIQGELEASSAAYELIAAAAAAVIRRRGGTAQRDELSTFRTEVLDMIQENWTNSQFGVEAMAAHFKMHRSQFSRRFLALFGSTPSSYLQRWRVRHALVILQKEQCSVQETAFQCGWDDANYFARCIRKATGSSPSKFRKNS